MAPDASATMLGAIGTRATVVAMLLLYAGQGQNEKRRLSRTQPGLRAERRDPARL
jgi:hypothetical protein